MLCYHLMFFPAAAFPAPTRGADSPALPHLLLVCQFNLTTLQERFDLIKPVAVSILLRGPSVSPLRLRSDADSYFFFLGYGLPPPFLSLGRTRRQISLLGPKNRSGRSKEGSGLASEPLSCLTWPCLRLSNSPRGGGEQRM